MNTREDEDIDERLNDDVLDIEGQKLSAEQAALGSQVTVPLEVNFTPFNHFSNTVPIQSLGYYPKFEFDRPEQVKPGFFETLGSELKETNTIAHLLRATDNYAKNPTDTLPDPNFDPREHQDKFINIDSKYYGYLASSKNEQEMNYRLNRVYEEQRNHNNIKNGGWMGYLGGMALGFVTDPVSYIPIVGFAKYAKFGETFLASAARSIPGNLAYAGISNASKQLDKIGGNLQDGLVNTMIDTAVGTALFGGLGVLELSADKSALWTLRSFLADHINGVGYRLKLDETEKVIGMEAYDTTGGSVSADIVKLAQDKADSMFLKSGVFKIPYLGTAAEKALSNEYFGSTALRMLRSPYKTIAMAYDLSHEHGIITTGMEKGKESPIKFFTLMQQTHSRIKAQEAQINAMWLERNGFDLDNYVAQSVTKAGLYTKDKVLDYMGKNIKDKPYVDRETFFSEIESVLFSKTKSQHNTVNEAANVLRKEIDETYKEYRQAYNLPDDWMPPRTAEGYLMRVYDTQFMNNNRGLWIQVVSDYLKKSDEIILKHTKPITDIEAAIKQNKKTQDKLIANKLATDEQKAFYVDQLITLKAQRKALRENLQNAIRNNPELQLLAEDWNKFSADEANELKQLLKRRNIVQKAIDLRKKKIAKLKERAEAKETAAIGNMGIDTAKKNKTKSDAAKIKIKQEETKLKLDEKELKEEIQKLRELAASGKVNRRFHDSNLEYYNPNQRLKLRKTYHHATPGIVHTDEQLVHSFREEHAAGYFDTITNQTAEDTINQTMGYFTGNKQENHIMQRTLMIPDELLYEHKFMTKDLLAKVANYKTYLDRRTHLKSVYGNVTIDGGFEGLAKELHAENETRVAGMTKAKQTLEAKLADKENLSEKEIKDLEKKLKKHEFDENKQLKEFEKAKRDLNFIYEKLMGISRLNKKQKAIMSGVKSATVAMNLAFLPLTMITDLSAIALKFGVMPFLKDGVFPTIESLGGVLKTKDSTFLRQGAAHLDLAINHLGSATAEKNIGAATNPYLNLGRIPAALDKWAHFGSNVSLANAMENMLQRLTSSVSQSEILRIMVAHTEGKMTKRDNRFLLRYGLNPKDAKAIVDQWKKYGGGKTKLGGYQSNYWHWQDMNAANKFSDAVYRSTYDTIIRANALDAPIWLDEYGALGIMGPIIKGFSGWGFASLNRYVIPFLQKPDATQFIGVLSMLAAGALVSPLRRIARGENPYPDDMTDSQWAYEVFSDSAFFSYFSNILNDANIMTGKRLLADLKNDKYRDRSRVGLLGPAWGDINTMADIIGAASSGEMNEADALKMARMVPPFSSPWTYWMSKAVVENFGLPKTRAIASRQ